MVDVEAAVGVLASLEAQGERLEVDVGGSTVVARAFGRGHPVLLLHGGAGSWNHWVRTLPALAARCRAVAVDLPGFGDSGLGPGVRGVDDLADVTAAAVDRLVPDARPAVVGFSFGGIVAGLVAARLGSRVDHLLLIGAGGLGLRSEVDAALVASPPAAPLGERLAAHRHNLAALMFADPDRIDDVALVAHDANVARARFRTGSIPSSSALVDALPMVAAPLTFATGAADAFSRGLADARRRVVRRVRPDAVVVDIAGAGHWAMHEQPEAVDALLAERLADRG